jgi:hypothetical protein
MQGEGEKRGGWGEGEMGGAQSAEKGISGIRYSVIGNR